MAFGPPAVSSSATRVPQSTPSTRVPQSRRREYPEYPQPTAHERWRADRPSGRRGLRRPSRPVTAAAQCRARTRTPRTARTRTPPHAQAHTPLALHAHASPPLAQAHASPSQSTRTHLSARTRKHPPRTLTPTLPRTHARTRKHPPRMYTHAALPARTHTHTARGVHMQPSGATHFGVRAGGRAGGGR